jgi:hypothetical protein
MTGWQLAAIGVSIGLAGGLIAIVAGTKVADWQWRRENPADTAPDRPGDDTQFANWQPIRHDNPLPTTNPEDTQ